MRGRGRLANEMPMAHVGAVLKEEVFDTAAWTSEYAFRERAAVLRRGQHTCVFDPGTDGSLTGRLAASLVLFPAIRADAAAANSSAASGSLRHWSDGGSVSAAVALGGTPPHKVARTSAVGGARVLEAMARAAQALTSRDGADGSPDHGSDGSDNDSDEDDGGDGGAN